MSCYHGCYHISETTLTPDSLNPPNSLLCMLGAGIEPAWKFAFQGILSPPLASVNPEYKPTKGPEKETGCIEAHGHPISRYHERYHVPKRHAWNALVRQWGVSEDSPRDRVYGNPAFWTVLV